MLRFACAAALAVAMALGSPASASPVSANPRAQASVRTLRPLKLTAIRDFDLGTIVLGAGLSPAGDVAWVNRQNIRRCGDTGHLTCSGVPQSASFNVQGTVNMQVTVRAVESNLINASGNDGMYFMPSPSLSTLTISGPLGTNFNIGGSVWVGPSTTEGLYVGDMDVTVDYQ